MQEPDLTTIKGRWGANMRRLRIQAGYRRQEDFANAIGYSIVAVGHWERGIRLIETVDAWFVVADALGISVEDLLPTWLRSDDPADWPVDLEVFLLMDSVKAAAMEIVKQLPRNVPKDAARFIQGALGLTGPVQVPPGMKGKALASIEQVVAAMKKDKALKAFVGDDRIVRFVVRKVRES